MATEDKQRYHFVATTQEKGGNWVAVIVDTQAAGVRLDDIRMSYQHMARQKSASAAFNASSVIRSRGAGEMHLTHDEILARMADVRQHGSAADVAAFQKAQERLEARAMPVAATVAPPHKAQRLTQ